MPAGRMESLGLRALAACGLVAGLADRLVVTVVRHPAILVAIVIAIPTWLVFDATAPAIIVLIVGLGLMWASFWQLERRDIDDEFGVARDRPVAGGSIDGATIAAAVLALVAGLLLSYRQLGETSVPVAIACLALGLVAVVGRSAGYVPFRPSAGSVSAGRHAVTPLGEIGRCRLTGQVFGAPALSTVRVGSTRVPRPMRSTDELARAAGRMRVVDGRARIARVPLTDATEPAAAVPSTIVLLAAGGGAGVGPGDVLRVEAGTAYRVTGARPAIRLETARLGRLVLAFGAEADRSRWLGELAGAASLRVSLGGVAEAPAR
jgi:hypothetical protein